MTRMFRAARKYLNHPLLSAAGNIQLLITGVPLVLAAAIAALGWLFSEPILFVIAIVLLIVDGALFVGILHNRPARKKPIENVPADGRRQVFVAVEGEVALAHEEALEMIKLLRAEWPYITVEGALVQTALPDWRTKTTDFIGTTLGSAQRAAFKASAVGPTNWNGWSRRDASWTNWDAA